MKKIITFSLVLILIFGIFLISSNVTSAYASSSFESSVVHKSSVLIEKNSGKILYDNNSSEQLPIASVTKLMTILLTLEKIDAGEISLTDKVHISENASGMGGSQIFIDVNLDYELGELLKSVIVASANDSSVALAEYIAGSESNFVKMMSDCAK